MFRLRNPRGVGSGSIRKKNSFPVCPATLDILKVENETGEALLEDAGLNLIACLASPKFRFQVAESPSCRRAKPYRHGERQQRTSRTESHDRAEHPANAGTRRPRSEERR